MSEEQSASRWSSIFASQADAMRRGEWGAAAEAIRSSLGDDPASLGELKRFARSLSRGATGTIDPWRIEMVLSRSEHGRRIVAPSALRSSRVPTLGVDEPETHARMLELARRALDALERGARALPEELAAEDGAPVVWWWITGEDAPAPDGPAELRVVATFASAVDRVLGPMGLLGSVAREDRAARVDEWRDRLARLEETEMGGDPFKLAFRASLESVSAWSDEAVEILVGLVRSRGDARAELDRAARLLATLLADEVREDEAGFARWCAAATALGILGAAPGQTDSLERYRARLARQLTARLSALAPRAPISLARAPADFVFWQAFPVLVRERAEAGDAALVAELLEAASAARLTGGMSKRLVRLARTLRAFEAAGGEDAAIDFVMRAAFRTSRDSNQSIRGLWKGVLKRHASFVAAASPYRAAIETWWAPLDAPVPLESLALEACVEITQRIAGPELDASSSLDACLSFWKRAPQREWCERERSEGTSARILSVPEALARYAARPALAATSTREASRVEPRLCLAIERMRGRHGEIYLAPRVFASGSGGVTVLLSDDVYDIPVDRRTALGEVRSAMERLRGAAELGRVTKSHVRGVQQAMASLASQRFWSGLAELIEEHGATLELPATDFHLPWELIPLPAKEEGAHSALAVHAPVVRPRGATTAPRRDEPRTLLLLLDPTQPGTIEEADRIEETFLDHDGEVLVAETVSELRALCEGHRFDVVHYAGHQGPAHDATPSLALRDGRVAIVELLDALHAAPPDLLFLHACSTLVPSRTIAGAEVGGEASEHTVYGALEPLTRSRVPAIVGTLWDVAPPEDRLFVRVFYRELLAHGDPIRAMHAARVDTSAQTHWAGWWPAYVLIAP